MNGPFPTSNPLVQALILRSTQKLVCVLVQRLGNGEPITVTNDELRAVDFRRLQIETSDDGQVATASYLSDEQVAAIIEAEAQQIIDDFNAAVARGDVPPLGAPEPDFEPTDGEAIAPPAEGS